MGSSYTNRYTKNKIKTDHGIKIRWSSRWDTNENISSVRVSGSQEVSLFDSPDTKVSSTNHAVAHVSSSIQLFREIKLSMKEELIISGCEYVNVTPATEETHTKTWDQMYILDRRSTTLMVIGIIVRSEIDRSN